MKVIYLGNHNNPENVSDTTEKHITYAFEKLGHEVICLDENEANITDILKIEKPDLFFFHKGGLHKNIPLDLMGKLLCHLTCKKAFWYFDKVFYERRQSEPYIEEMLKYVDAGFLTDGTWIRRHKYKNLHWLNQGIGAEDKVIGKFRKEYECDVAFLGSPYGEERMEFVALLQQKYGNKFKVFQNVFNKDLYDLSVSAKVIVAPPYPSEEFYWSSRFYMTLGSGGFLVHPDLYGLKEEFESDKHFVGYKNMKEMLMIIDFFLGGNEERRQIQKAGQEQCLKVATYEHRIKEMLKIIAYCKKNGNKTS